MNECRCVFLLWLNCSLSIRDQHVRQRATVRCRAARYRALPRSAAKRKIFDASPRAAQHSVRSTAHRTVQRKCFFSICIQFHSLPIDLDLKILFSLQKSDLALQIDKCSLSSIPMDLEKVYQTSFPLFAKLTRRTVAAISLHPTWSRLLYVAEVSKFVCIYFIKNVDQIHARSPFRFSFIRVT